MQNLCAKIKFNIAFLNVHHVTCSNHLLRSMNTYISNYQFSYANSE